MTLMIVERLLLSIFFLPPRLSLALSRHNIVIFCYYSPSCLRRDLLQKKTSLGRQEILINFSREENQMHVSLTYSSE